MIIRLVALVIAATTLPVFADGSLKLIPNGVQCDVGAAGQLVLGIPALDGRGTHLAPAATTVRTDGRILTGSHAAPFAGVTLKMKLLDGNKVEYDYDHLPPDVHIVMCGINLPASSLAQGVTITFDDGIARTIPAQPGKTNKDVNLASLHSRGVKIQWPSGDSLTLTGPEVCWFGIQDARVWSKDYVSVSLTPPLARTGIKGEQSTFTMIFAVAPPTASP